ncbi:MAG: pyruvate, phosphate dikinase, partial [Dehalococcoidia bacterium]
MTKRIYRFGEGSAQQRDLLGGKGANLSEMARLGLPVPPGFIISTEACRQYNRLRRRLPNGLWEDVQAHLREVESAVGRAFGDPANPLLVSVRSGAKFSMPGMMDTILNLGLNDETTAGLAALSGDERFALDCHRRFLQLFGKVVLRLPSEAFEDALAEARESAGVASDAEIAADQLRRLVQRFKEIIGEHSSIGVPDDPWQQLRMAIEAVFDSWNNRRAIAYREHHHIPRDLGTAVTVMAMVFGNLGRNSGSGVCFSRNPADGTRELYGEYLPNAQGEDVVSGARTPKPIAELASELPDAYNQLGELADRLEAHYRDVQDIEFTVENGRLYMLQTRVAKRTSLAAIKVAVAMVEEDLISPEEALLRVSPNDLAQILLPRFEEEAKQEAVRQGRLLGRGLNASPGAAAGVAV